MKKWKKYPFFFLIAISSFCYWEYKMMDYFTDKKETATVSVDTISHKEDKGIAPSGRRTIKKKTETTILPKDDDVKETVTVLETATERSFQRVEMDYLEDALFIGDSRTATLYEYAGWESTDFFVKYGLTVWDVWENTMDGRKLDDILSAKQYGKIYIMLGINELGAGTPDSFGAQFQTVIEEVRKYQPQAVIFVESIMHVTAGKDAQGTYINNQEINVRNEKLKLLADNQNIFYIDENEVMDEPGTGKLREEYSFDGVHLQVKYIDVWREFLLDHGIK